MTESGVKAKAKSRIVPAIDRLGGNLFELANAPLERRIARQRAIMDGETKLVDAVARFGIEKLAHDPEFAERAANDTFKAYSGDRRIKTEFCTEHLKVSDKSRPAIWLQVRDKSN